MTEVEDTLLRALTAEADRHEPPVFNAYRIAEAVTVKRRFRRRPLFALVAAAIGAAAVGGGGAAVVAAGGGHHALADPVSVTFQSKTGTVGSQVTDASVKSWVGSRAKAEGLHDVTVEVRHSPWRMTVTGHTADLDRLKTLGEPGVVQFGPMADVSTAAVSDAAGIGYHVVATHASPLDLQTNYPIWDVQVQFDTAGTKAFAGFTTQFVKQTVGVMIDGTVKDTPTLLTPITNGKFTFTGDWTKDQARLLAAILSTQGPADLEGAKVTVGAG
jgi:hypothetical protein